MKKTRTLYQFVCVGLVLSMATCAWGFGLDGTRHSADFSNSLGIWPGYATWSFEGGSVANPIEDIEGNSGSTYDTVANHTSDGSIKRHVDSPQASNSGHYDVLNPILAPVVADGYTWEFRAKYNDLQTFDTLVGHFWAMNLVDDWQESHLRFLDGYWTNPGGDPISQVKFGGTTYNLPAPLSEWHTYRVAVLGQDTAGDNLIHANLYQDTTLIASSSWAAGSNPGDAVAWMGVNWAWEVGQVDVELDYFRIDGTGAWAPPPAPECGDLGYLNSDINEDCYVDAVDVGALGAAWLECNHPLDPNCSGYIDPPGPDLPVIPQGAVTVDGDPNEWSGATWIDLSEVYYGDPNDMPSGQFALRWDSGTGKLYAVARITDTTHWFVDDYTSPAQWNASDRLEIFCQGDDAGGGYTTAYDEAQQYMVGPPDTAPGPWAKWADSQAINPDAGFEYAVTLDGDDIIYEIGVTPFDFYATKAGSGTTVQSTLAVDKVVRFDIVADTRWGPTVGNPGDFGARSANTMLNKFSNADAFERYQLGN